TTYVDCVDRSNLTGHWLKLHQQLNPDCDVLLVDSQSPLSIAEQFGPFETHVMGRKAKKALHCFPDNIGHLSRRGRDGWGRAFCYGLEAAVAAQYDYVVHIEGDSLLRLPVRPLIEDMVRQGTKVASIPVR